MRAKKDRKVACHFVTFSLSLFNNSFQISLVLWSLSLFISPSLSLFCGFVFVAVCVYVSVFGQMCSWNELVLLLQIMFPKSHKLPNKNLSTWQWEPFLGINPQGRWRFSQSKISYCCCPGLSPRTWKLDLITVDIAHL